ncbi:MAG: hypothetical protein JWQ35_1417 [Bacteriovoracaceae bacterium]|nr:hypothetical protein [Bacteriovoracaceae bacterium]
MGWLSSTILMGQVLIGQVNNAPARDHLSIWMDGVSTNKYTQNSPLTFFSRKYEKIIRKKYSVVDQHWKVNAWFHFIDQKHLQPALKGGISFQYLGYEMYKVGGRDELNRFIERDQSYEQFIKNPSRVKNWLNKVLHSPLNMEEGWVSLEDYSFPPEREPLAYLPSSLLADIFIDESEWMDAKDFSVPIRFVSDVLLDSNPYLDPKEFEKILKEFRNAPTTNTQLTKDGEQISLTWNQCDSFQKIFIRSIYSEEEIVDLLIKSNSVDLVENVFEVLYERKLTTLGEEKILEFIRSPDASGEKLERIAQVFNKRMNGLSSILYDKIQSSTGHARDEILSLLTAIDPEKAQPILKQDENTLVDRLINKKGDLFYPRTLLLALEKWSSQTKSRLLEAIRNPSRQENFTDDDKAQSGLEENSVISIYYLIHERVPGSGTAMAEYLANHPTSDFAQFEYRILSTGDLDAIPFLEKYQKEIPDPQEVQSLIERLRQKASKK